MPCAIMRQHTCSPGCAVVDPSRSKCTEGGCSVLAVVLRVTCHTTASKLSPVHFFSQVVEMWCAVRTRMYLQQYRGAQYFMFLPAQQRTPTHTETHVRTHTLSVLRNKNTEQHPRTQTHRASCAKLLQCPRRSGSVEI